MFAQPFAPKGEVARSTASHQEAHCLVRRIKRPGGQRAGADRLDSQPSQIPPPLSRLRSIARSRSFCWRTLSGGAVPCALPLIVPVMLVPVGRAVPSPGCPAPVSGPLRARGIVLPAVVSPVVGDAEPGGAAAELGAGPLPGADKPVGPIDDGAVPPVEPAAAPAFAEAPPDEAAPPPSEPPPV